MDDFYESTNTVEHVFETSFRHSWPKMLDPNCPLKQPLLQTPWKATDKRICTTKRILGIEWNITSDSLIFSAEVNSVSENEEANAAQISAYFILHIRPYWLCRTRHNSYGEKD